MALLSKSLYWDKQKSREWMTQMGEWFEFKCPKCGYRAEVSGGKDCGMVAVTETMICESCRELVDVQIGFAIPSPDNKWDKEMGRCPECRSDDLTPWRKSRPCPKCSTKMLKGRKVADWD